jgi:hypothetical protein
MAGGIAVVLIILAMAVVIGGCTNPLSGDDNQTTVTPTPPTQPAITPTPAATQAPTAMPTLLPTPTPEPTSVPDEITRTYEWTFNNQSYSVYFGVLKSDYDIYKNRPHTRGSDYAGYKISDDERIYFIELVGRLMDVADDIGPGENSSAMAVTGFLQSLPNVSIGMTAAYNDYPKYPLETLVDGGGDSEDLSILAANLLNQMGYRTVLLGFPGHMAVGLQSNEDLPGRYYEYNGARYYYLETTPPLRGLGDIPEAYRNVSATIYTMRETTGISLNMTASPANSDLYAYYNVTCDVKNNGEQTAQNVSVYFAALALSYGDDRVWMDAEVNVGDIPAGEKRTAEATLRIPYSMLTQFECIASGDNFDPVTTKGEQFSL